MTSGISAVGINMYTSTQAPREGSAVAELQTAQRAQEKAAAQRTPNSPESTKVTISAAAREMQAAEKKASQPAT